jgi:hypothetical protein
MPASNRGRGSNSKPDDLESLSSLGLNSSQTALSQSRPGSASEIPYDRLEHMLTNLTSTLIEAFNSSQQLLVKTFCDSTQQKLDFQNNEIFNSAKRVDNLEKIIDSHKTQNETLKASVAALEKKLDYTSSQLDDLDQHGRLENLIIHGVPLPQSGETEDLYIKLPQVLNTLLPEVHLASADISVVHRLQAQSNSNIASASHPRPPSIIVRFTRKAIRQSLLQHRRQLKGKQVSIAEHLTAKRASLLKRASTLVSAGRLLSAWSKDGKIVVKTISNHFVTITKEAELDKFV